MIPVPVATNQHFPVSIFRIPVILVTTRSDCVLCFILKQKKFQ